MAIKSSVSKNSRSGKSKLSLFYDGKLVELVVFYDSDRKKSMVLMDKASGSLIIDQKTKLPVHFSKDTVTMS